MPEGQEREVRKASRAEVLQQSGATNQREWVQGEDRRTEKKKHVGRVKESGKRFGILKINFTFGIPSEKGPSMVWRISGMKSWVDFLVIRCGQMKG